MDILLENQMAEEEDETVEHGYELEADEQEEQVYPMNNVKVDKGFYTIFELKRRFDAEPGRIILDSDFQREFLCRRNGETLEIHNIQEDKGKIRYIIERYPYERSVECVGNQSR